MKHLDVNPDIKQLKRHLSKEISDLVRDNSDIIDLTVGLPNYGTPKSIANIFIEELIHANDEVQDYDKHADTAGYLPLRQAIADYYRLHYRMAIDYKNQILITNGAAGGIWTAIHTLTKYGDDILIPDPAYILYESITKSLGRNPIRIPTSVESGFLPQPQIVESFITPKSTMIIINSPANPTGKILDLKTFRALCKITKDRSLFLLHDEVFDTIVYRGKHVPALAIDPSATNIIMVNSISKRLGMSGWRLGWLVGHPDIVKELIKAHTFMSLSVHALTQKGISKMFNEPSLQSLLMNRTQGLYNTISRFMNRLRQVDGFSSVPESLDAGFYLLLNVESLFQKLPGPYRLHPTQGEAVAQYLLDCSKIAVVPGYAFGKSTENYVRLSLACGESKLNMALTRFEALFDTPVKDPQLSHKVKHVF